METIELQHIDIQSRQRQDMGDVTGLMDSIKELGLIQPIVIEMIGAYGKDGPMFPRLVAGRRRMHALMQLGHTHVFHGTSCDPTRPGFVFYHEQTELKRQLVEFEEDIRRKNRTWQEEVIGIDRIHKIKWAIEGAEWGQKQTGELLGVSRAKVCYTLQLAEEILRDREGAVAKAETYTDGLKILLERNELVLMEEQNRRRAAFRAKEVDVVNTGGLPLFEEQAVVNPTIIQLSNMVFHGDFKTIAEADLPADFVSCALVLDQLDEQGWKQIDRLIKMDSYLIVRSEDAIWWRTCFPTNTHFSIPWPVIWNVLGMEPDEVFPFAQNAKHFTVLAKGNPKPFNPSNSSVFSANRDGQWPPASFIEFLLRPISQIGSTILMPCGGPCESVARIGRYPISFETDEARYVAVRDLLKGYYESTLPKVEFR
jgi:hypothetical protein